MNENENEIAIVIVIVIFILILIDSCFIFLYIYIYNIKMSYYWFNRQGILQKAKERYSKEKSAEYYMQNKEVIKER